MLTRIIFFYQLTFDSLFVQVILLVKKNRKLKIVRSCIQYQQTVLKKYLTTFI